MSFFVLDGIDGCGKSTHARRLAEYLRGAGREAVLLKEPTSESPAGRRLMEAVASGSRPSPEEELELFIEDRRWDVENRILPALEQGMDVVLDRYYYSTVAYQGARGMDTGMIWEMNSFAPVPDIAFIMDIGPETAGERLKRRKSTNYFEKRDYLGRVREIFLSMEALSEVIIIDSSGSTEETWNGIKKVVDGVIR